MRDPWVERGGGGGGGALYQRVQQREVRVDLHFIILPEELAAVLVKAKKSKATSKGWKSGC